jgi:hypothetical protein
LLCACNQDEFLDESPLDQITETSYWKSESDLELYLNTFYALFPGWGSHDGGPFWRDNNSDNMVPGVFDARMAGVSTIPQSGGSWIWSNVRAINIFLANYPKVIEERGGTNDDIDHFIGEGYFFRAYVYFDLLQNFGGVPWIDTPLDTDSPELYAAREPRNVIADHILEDLDQAIELMKDDPADYRINRSVALAFKSRVALYEGTWEKYHAGTPYGAPGGSAETYLRTAAEAAGTLMEEGWYSVANTGAGINDYVTLFNQSDLSNNPEVILHKRYILGFNAHNGQRFLSIIGGNTGVSKSLVESYLCIDGKPIAESDLYQGDDNLTQEFTNRDPRLDATVFDPGDAINEDQDFVVAPVHLGGEASVTTGYQIQKGALPNKQLQQADFGSTTAAIIFRYAEVLLNYAEAKAELGELTDADLNISINLLRDRVGMPHLEIGSIVTDPNWEFPGLSPILNEVRRERRVELACEGFRFNDLMRWRAHEVFVGKRPKGAKFVPSDYPGFSNILLDENGYIDRYQIALPAGYQFNPERDYLRPVPLNEFLFNRDLIQNPGWPTN